MFKPIRRAELIKGGFTIKQGEIFTLGFQLFDAGGDIITLTDEIVTAKIANNTGVIHTATATIVGDHIEFTVDENIGYGKMRVELKVTDGDAILQKYPADGWIELKISPSLDDLNVGGIDVITASAMFAEIATIDGVASNALSVSQTADGKADDAVTIAESAVEVAEGVRGEFNQVVAEAGSNNPEVVQARGTFVNLNERLNNTNQQLAETSAQLGESEKLKYERTNENRKAYITIIEDDGKADFFTKLKPVYDSHGVKPSVAINSFQIGTAGYMTWAQIEQLHAEGYEILNHGWTGVSPHLSTLAEMQANYALEKAKFIEHGLPNYDYYVYSGSQPLADGALKNKIRQVYKSSYANSNTKESYIPFDHYEIKRYPMQLLPQVKTYIDFAVENKSYCALMGHSYVVEYTATMLDEILTHIESKGVAIEYRQAKDMIDSFSNQIEIGNTGADYFYLDANGNVDFSVKGKSINDLYKEVDAIQSFSDTYFADKPITDYPTNSTSIEIVEQANAIKLGLADAGLVTTVKAYNPSLPTLLTFSGQEYSRFNTPEKWVRKWNQTMARWNLFLPLVGVSLPTASRPRYAEVGTTIFDTTLNLPIWCKTKGYKPNKTIARNTAYNKWDVVYSPITFANMLCTTAGTTGASEPTWQIGSFKNTTDGTIVWEYVGADAVWVNGAGTVV